MHPSGVLPQCTPAQSRTLRPLTNVALCGPQPPVEVAGCRPAPWDRLPAGADAGAAAGGPGAARRWWWAARSWCPGVLSPPASLLSPGQAPRGLPPSTKERPRGGLPEGGGVGARGAWEAGCKARTCALGAGVGAPAAWCGVGADRRPREQVALEAGYRLRNMLLGVGPLLTTDVICGVGGGVRHPRPGHACECPRLEGGRCPDGRGPPGAARPWGFRQVCVHPTPTGLHKVALMHVDGNPLTSPRALGHRRALPPRPSAAPGPAPQKGTEPGVTGVLAAPGTRSHPHPRCCLACLCTFVHAPKNLHMPCVCHTLGHGVRPVPQREACPVPVPPPHASRPGWLPEDAPRDESSFLRTSAMLTPSAPPGWRWCPARAPPGDFGCGIWQQGRVWKVLESLLPRGRARVPSGPVHLVKHSGSTWTACGLFPPARRPRLTVAGTVTVSTERSLWPMGRLVLSRVKVSVLSLPQQRTTDGRLRTMETQAHPPGFPPAALPCVAGGSGADPGDRDPVL